MPDDLRSRELQLMDRLRDSRGGALVSRTGCRHPPSELVPVNDDGSSSSAGPLVWWCPMCGSVRIGQHGEFWEPDGKVLPGWECGNCGAFNGVVKEVQTCCRACGGARR